jgi:acyl-CoA thioesterase I
VNKKMRLVNVVLAICFALMASSARGDIITKLKQGKSLTISAIGTSLSATSNSTWFAEMGKWLNTEYPGKVTMDNEAIGGSASANTAWFSTDISGLDVQLPAALTHNPDAIFIEFAINDASTDVKISLAESKQNLQTMIDRIKSWATTKSKSVDIVIQTMNNDPLSGLRPELAAYEQGYRDVAKANGLLLIDHYPTWTSLYNDNPTMWHDYVPDHVHPGPLGTEKIILPEIQKALNSQTPEPSSTVLLLSGACGLAAYAWRKAK